MKNTAHWTPSKYTLSKSSLKASRDTKHVTVSSRLIADIIAAFYAENIPTYVSGKLLDLGCGMAPLYCLYKDYATDITCVDWGNSMHENSYLDFEQDLNQPLEIETGTYQAIILSDVLEHIRKPELLLSETHRILASDGYLLMNVPFFYWLHEQPFDYFRYTQFALKSMAEDCGYTIVSLKPYGGAPEILTDISAKLLKNIPVVGKFMAMVVQKITWLFIKTKFGKKISHKTAQSFPFGYVMIAQKK
jgi:SAM-dependent methyltransferase